MANEDQNQRLCDLKISPQLNPVESAILRLLRTYHRRKEDRIIDVPRLQEECRRNGLSASEFSQGFIQLLVRRLLEPCGDFTYTLAAEKDEPQIVTDSREDRRDKCEIF